MTLWGNRNVLEVSCHIDNWLALHAGEQVSYMVKHVPWMAENCLLGSKSAKTISSALEDSPRSEDVLKSNFDLERCKFLCQMAILKPEDAHLDKSMTFLGCSMEMLRSSLAKWTGNAGTADEWMWTPLIPTCDETSDRTRNTPVLFKASDILTSFLHSIKCISQLSERYVEMSVLWELQNQLHCSLPDDGLAPNDVKAMALCILSFPALSMEIRLASHSRGASRNADKKEHVIVDLDVRGKCEFEIEEYEYAIRASCGPQDICVVVSFSWTEAGSKMMMSVGICREDEGKIGVFDWQLWRDSFYGRLEGSRRWQQKLGIENYPLMRTTKSIRAGIEQRNAAGTGSTMSVWNGWAPPRTSICMYEIASPGFVMQAVDSGTISVSVQLTETLSDSFNVPRETWAHVPYKDANQLSLKLASLVGEEELKRAEAGADASYEALHEALTRPENLMRNERNSNRDLALLFLERDAVKRGDVASLNNAMALLLRSERTANAITRAVTLLERFYISWKSDSEPLGWSVTHLHDF